MTSPDVLATARALIAALDGPTPMGRSHLPPDGQLDRVEWGGGEAEGFNRLDANADGRLSDRELAAALEALPAEARRSLHEAAEACTAALAAHKQRTLACLGVLGLGGAISLVGLIASAFWRGPALWASAGLGLSLLGLLVGAGWLDGRRLKIRRALVRALAVQAEGAGIGLEGASLAAPIIRLLARMPRSIFQALDGTLAMPLGVLGAGRWEYKSLSRALGGLPLGRRQAIADLTDRAQARARAVGNLAAVGGFGLLAGPGVMLCSLQIAAGGRSKTGRMIPPNPEAGASFLHAGVAILALGLALIGLALALQAWLRRRLASDVVAQAEGRV